MKFTRDSDLIAFQCQVMDKLEKYGMDMITYLPNPADKTKLVSVITDHGWFTLKEGVKSAEDIAKGFDKYDKGNSADAREFLHQQCR